MAGRETIPDTQPRALFASLGFRCVHRLLWWVLASCCLLAGLAFGLGWVLEGDITVRAEGAIRPRSRHLVKSGIDGVVETIAVRGGDRVEAGDILAVLSPHQVRARLQQVEQELSLSVARQRALQAQIDHERRVLDAVVAARRVDVERAAATLTMVRREQQLSSSRIRPGWRRLPLDELVPTRQALAGLAQARAQLEVVRRQLQAAQAREREIELEQGQWLRLESERQALWQRLEGTVLRAPVAGVVLTRDLELRAGDRVQVGEALLELAAGNAWNARVLVRQIDRPKLRPGQRARVFVRAYPHLQYGSVEGSLHGIAEQAAASAPYPVDVELSATDLALADGMAAEVRIAIDSGPLLQLAWRRLLHEFGRAPLPNLRAART